MVAGLIYGAIGIAQAAAFALLRYRRSALARRSRRTRCALLNSLGHRVHRRGRVPRRDPRAPHPHRRRAGGQRERLQAVLYALATRLGAPGRDRYMLVLSIMIGLAGGLA